MGTRCADHVTPLYPQKLALTSPTGGGRSVGIVRVRTKAMEFFLCRLRSMQASPGHAVARAVGRFNVTAEGRVLLRSSLCGIYG